MSFARKLLGRGTSNGSAPSRYERLHQLARQLHTGRISPKEYERKRQLILRAT